MADAPDLEALQRAIAYRFADEGRLRHALVHRSAPNERPADFPESNERLEFLGDAVLDLVIARALYERFPDASEGALTRYKSTLVSEAALATLARGLQLGLFLVLGRGEEETRGCDKPSILCDALEAILGAVYLDGGMDPVERVILTLFHKPLETVHQRSAPRGDYKTALQEWTQAQGLGLPTYRLLDASGPDHRRVYTVAVVLAGRELARGAGTSKRDAERLAAENAMRALTAPAPGPDVRGRDA